MTAPAAEPAVRARRPRRRRWRAPLLVVAGVIAATNVAQYAQVQGVAAVDDVLRAALPCLALFAVCGFPLVRLALPEALRPHEWLWLLPAGACAAAIELSVLGYLHVPLPVSLAAVGAVNAVLGAVAVRRAGLPARPRPLGRVGWPLWLALLVACVALIPTFRAGVATVQGYGSDAHMAAGTAQLLREHPPTATAIEEPIDRLWTVWRSKPPIYYPMAATAELSGMETWQVLSTVAAIMLALAAIGFFLLAREGLGAGMAGAGIGLVVVGLDRVSLYTAMHPYYNQIWGFFTLPFALLLALWVVRLRSRAAGALLVLFLAVGAFAYPLMLPMPVIALAVLLWGERRRLAALRPSRRALLWLVPLALVLALPAAGVLEKVLSSIGIVVDPSRSLETWGGDMLAFMPEWHFFAFTSWSAMAILGPFLLAALVWELRRAPRPAGLALGAVVAFGVLAALWFRPRDFGWYFHFKALAFVGPLAVLVATVGLSRLRGRWAALALAVMALMVVQGARDEMAVTYDQTPRAFTSLRGLDARLPPDASVRLDLDPNEQVWGAYFLSGQPLCSRAPLVGTAYPHVQYSEKADYALIDHRDQPRPADAVGGPVWTNEWFALFRLRPDLPGPDRCSRAMVQTI